MFLRKKGYIKLASIMLAILYITGSVFCVSASADEVAVVAETAQGSIPITVENFTATGMATEVKSNYNGQAGNAVITGDSGEITWQFSVPEEGDYNLKLNYFPIESKYANIVLGVKIDGEYLDANAEEVTLTKLYKNEHDKIQVDTRNNQILPKQIQAITLVTDYIKKVTATDNSPYVISLTPGEHTLTFVGKRDKMAIVSMEFCKPVETPTYKDYQKQISGKKVITDYKGYIEAEDARYKSSSTMVPVNDRTSALISPSDAYRVLYNTFNSSSIIGEYATWDFEVPEDGIYQLAVKFRQKNSTTVLPVSKFYIDDKIPFKEMEKVEFAYDRKWQMMRVTVDGEAAGIYLTKGSHTLKIETAIGSFAEYIDQIQDIAYNLNAYYRSIIMITGTSPDTYRDYQIDVKLPEVMKGLEEAGKALTKIIEELDAKKLGTAEMVEVSTIRDQILDFVDEPGTIQERLNNFKTNIGALSDWCITMSKQSVSFDYFMVCGKDVENERAEANFFESMWMEIKSLVSSFINDYNSIGDTSGAEKKITVWMVSGRDQANIMKRLVDSDFSNSHNNIAVDLKLVQNASVLSALIAGKGPDVALEMAQADPVDYALRNAVVDLSKLEGFDEVVSRFHESAVIPFSFNGGVYALPEKQTFPMMFYRTDVLEDLGLEVPKTWREVSTCLTELTNANMEFGVSAADAGSALTSLSMFLYQNGGQLYIEDDTKSGLTSKIALDSFKQLTDLYTSYKLPYAFNAHNRFRSGEMPIIIAGYELYNQLCISAPEIKGLWGVTIVPGTAKEDGTIDNSVAGTVTGCIITSSAKDLESAWSFVKWWTSAESQAGYGNQLENLLGQAARYATANIEALEMLPWSDQELAQLNTQWNSVKPLPQVPGSYFTSRHVYNAFRRVLSYSDDPRQTLTDYAGYIDEEIRTKRDEFGLELGDNK